jgi:hypothetical protein
MSPRHLDDLFSAAYEEDLSPADEARFDAHIQTCQPCADAYEEFKAGIAALRELPKARMPHAVHLPSTAPVAERPPRPTIGLSWFNLGLVRRFPATAIAGVAAVVIVIFALAHGSGPTAAPGTAAGPGPAGNAAVAPATEQSPAADASCTTPTAITGSSPPANFAQVTQAADPQEPAVHLVLATPSQVVNPGTTTTVYAQLSVPASSLLAPGYKGATPPARAILPCVSVIAASTGEKFQVLETTPLLPNTYNPGAAGLPGPVTASGSLLTFAVPAGLIPGTELQVTATIPAGYAAFGSPALTAELTLTIG